MASCPGRLPSHPFEALRGNGYPQVSPSFRRVSREYAQMRDVVRLLLRTTSVIPGFPRFKTYDAVAFLAYCRAALPA